MRPCKAKGHKARCITVELAYCLSSTFPVSSARLQLSKGMVLPHISSSGPGPSRFDTPDSSMLTTLYTRHHPYSVKTSTVYPSGTFVTYLHELHRDPRL